MSRLLIDYFAARLDESLLLLKNLVEFESHSQDCRAVDALAVFVAAKLALWGARTELIRTGNSAAAVKAVWSTQDPGPPLLLLGHLDTVWPAGTIQQRPFSIRNGKAFGPGIYDMKAGILLSLLVCRAFSEGLAQPGKDVIFVFTPDEEIGTAAGRPVISSVAGSCRAVLCLEPCLPGGAAKTARKGVGEFTISIKGVPAHAGADHHKGVSAILELSRIVIGLQSLSDHASGITVNVGLIRGGSAANIVPASAEAVVDFRFPSAAAGRLIEEKIRSVAPYDARCKVRVEGGIERMPLERTAGVINLYQKARQAARRVGMDMAEGSSGGASDGSITAAMGVPTLDGLGVDGDGAHAEDEHIIIADIPRRAAFLCELIASV